MTRVAVVGASLAGLSSVRALRRQGFDGELVLVGDELHRPYDRTPLSKQVLAGTMSVEQTALEGPDDDQLASTMLLGRSAVGLRPGDQTLLLDGGEQLSVDGVVVATGAQARRLPVGHELAGVHVLRTLDDCLALRAELRPGARLVVVGAGFIGAEVASTARALGLEVTVLEAAAVPMVRALGEVVGGSLAGLHGEHGVLLRCGVGVRGLSGVGRVSGVQLDDGTVLPADVVVVGVGAAPAVQWLDGSGVRVEDGVWCDARGATSVPHVVAAGDCARWYDVALAAHHRVEHWTGALERPAFAARALLDQLAGGGATTGLSGGLPTSAGTPAEPRPPYLWSDQYEVRLQLAGWPHTADGVEVVEGDLAARSAVVVYRRRGDPVAVLGLNQPRVFGRWRRSLVAPVLAGATGSSIRPP